jgi:hypothetical protein
VSVCRIDSENCPNRKAGESESDKRPPPWPARRFQNSDRLFHEAERSSPGVERVVLKADRIVPKAERVAPKAERFAPKAERVILDPLRAGPRFERLVPKPGWNSLGWNRGFLLHEPARLTRR